ncbi:MAG: hypothetical protein EB121_05355, partial [Alphaproteobacteria bacterium]|nr:hypothetical protein [Alphaproteobacteria bacterium]
MSEVAPATAEQTGKKLSLASKSKHTGQGFGHGGFAELLSATTMPLGDDKPLEAKKTKKIDDGVDDAACEKTCDHGKKDKHDEPRSLKKIDTSVMAMDGVDENIAAEGAHDAIVLDVEAVEEATAHLEKMVAELDPDDAEFLAHHLSLAAATDPLKKET